MRDVAYSPDGSYFVVVTTGAPYAGTLCDTAARWETAATGADLQPTWIDYTGGDTLLSVGISEQAVYVGGHIRWLNNSLRRRQRRRRRGRPGQHRRPRPGQRPAAVLEPGPAPARRTASPRCWSPRQGVWLGTDQRGSATSSTAGSGSRSSR